MLSGKMTPDHLNSYIKPNNPQTNNTLHCGKNPIDQGQLISETDLRDSSNRAIQSWRQKMRG